MERWEIVLQGNTNTMLGTKELDSLKQWGWAMRGKQGPPFSSPNEEYLDSRAKENIESKSQKGGKGKFMGGFCLLAHSFYSYENRE